VKALPRLMVAPTGARRTPLDHPALPVTLTDILAEAKACHAAGADGLHLHVRDSAGAHTLDVERYREAIQELAVVVPSMAVQITTEAVGQYSPHEQREVVNAIRPNLVSIAISEMMRDTKVARVDRFYTDCAEQDIAVQHIVYTPEELPALIQMIRRLQLPLETLQLIFVLGRYTEGQQSNPETLFTFLQALDAEGLSGRDVDWMVCAFGPQETLCLKTAWQAGGKMRVGFENSLWNADGSVAANNAERVAEIVKQCDLA